MFRIALFERIIRKKDSLSLPLVAKWCTAARITFDLRAGFIRSERKCKFYRESAIREKETYDKNYTRQRWRTLIAERNRNITARLKILFVRKSYQDRIKRVIAKRAAAPLRIIKTFSLAPVSPAVPPRFPPAVGRRIGDGDESDRNKHFGNGLSTIFTFSLRFCGSVLLRHRVRCTFSRPRTYTKAVTDRSSFYSGK